MIIETKLGKIEGVSENGCDIYKGIPYAKAPVGALRFRKPQPVEPWEGVYQADHFRNKCMQGPARPGFYLKEFYSNPEFQTEPSESGLYLNIWVPQEHMEGPCPVAVYVHGGAFMGGAGSNLPFVCDRLAKAGVIVVTMNYRLGVFGFLCHPVLGVDGENEAGGNYGLWDQVQAFCWVKENIAAFGGDPENVTAFGQSAGAMSLQALSVSPAAEGLFQHVILQSGGGYKNPLGGYKSIGEAAVTAEDFFEALGFTNKEWETSAEKKAELLTKLHTASTEEIMEAMGTVIGKSFAKNTGLPFVPVVDGELLPQDGNRQIAEGKFHKVPYILGANKDDMTTEGQEERTQENNAMQQANIRLAETVNEEGSNAAYVYFFERRLPGDERGAFHSAELWYVFGSLEYCWRPLTEADRALSDEMIAYWSNFMKSGDPNGQGLEAWNPCTREDAFVKIFDVKQVR